MRAPGHHRLKILAIDPRCIAAATADRDGLAPVMPFAHHLHLRGGGQHFQTALPHHRLQHVPTGVGHQLQQRFVDRDQRHIGLVCRAAVGALDRQRDMHRVAHVVFRLVGGDIDRQPVRIPPDFHLRHAQPIAGLGQVDRRGRGRGFARKVRADHRHLPHHVGQPLAPPADAAAHRQHRNEDIRRITAGHRHRNHRIGARQLRDKARQHAFAFDGDERGRLTERHAHLEPRVFARAVFGLFGDHIHTIAIVAAEPPRILAHQPHRAHRAAFVPLCIGHARHGSDLARNARRDLAPRQAVVVAGGGAALRQLRDFLLVVIGVEPADQATARGDGFARVQIDMHRCAGDWLVVQIDHNHLHPQIVAAHDPAIGFQPDLQVGGKQPQIARRGHRLAIGVGVIHFDGQADRAGDRTIDRDIGLCGAIGPQRCGQSLGIG